MLLFQSTTRLLSCFRLVIFSRFRASELQKDSGHAQPIDLFIMVGETSQLVPKITRKITKLSKLGGFNKIFMSKDIMVHIAQ